MAGEDGCTFKCQLWNPNVVEESPENLTLHASSGVFRGWRAHAAVAVGLVLSLMALLSLQQLLPGLNNVLYPGSILALGIPILVATAAILEYSFGHRVLLTTDEVAIAWGFLRKSVRWNDAAVILTLEDGRRKFHGAVGRGPGAKVVYFGSGMSAYDFEIARRWLISWSHRSGIPYRQASRVQDLVTIVQEARRAG